ncbi:unnamed protein product [Closterium sp. Yama58-4]|nr:unnamed protein product [Closterium sp. Yama58-4]
MQDKEMVMGVTGGDAADSLGAKEESVNVGGNEGDSDTSLSSQQRHQQEELVGNPVGRLKIYVYDLPRDFNYNFIKKQPRCLTHMFALEVLFHRYILNSPVRTTNPDEADWFYMPVYPTCDLTASGLPLPFRSPRMIRAGITLVSEKWPYWNRTDGADHFFITPHDFGACFHYEEEKAITRGIMPLLKRATLVQTFGQSHHVCHKPGSIVVPPFAPTGHMHRRRIPPDTPRSIFVYFRGLFYDRNNDPQGGYYASVFSACHLHGADTPRSIFVYFRGLFYDRNNDPQGGGIVPGEADCTPEHPASYYEDMQRSLFCLCPLGWAPWSPRLVESVFFGCIPVIIADNIVLPFSDVIPWREIAVFVPEKDVPKLDEILAGIGPKRVLAMQQRLASHAIRQAVVLGHPQPQEGDVFHQVLNGLARKLPHPPSTYLQPGDERLNWTAGPANDFKPWKPDSHVYW